jgi:tRNA threonylcarbamoyladenosine biosynthesis protein TsaE
MKIITNSEKETYNFAKKFAKTLKGSEIIGLIGDLGAGKTIFTKGLGAGLGIKENITSPTFVLMKIYPVKNHKTIKQLCHIDAYRISAHDIFAIGADDYFNNKYTVSVVEWANNIKDILPVKIINVNIINKEGKRILVLIN